MFTGCSSFIFMLNVPVNVPEHDLVVIMVHSCVLLPHLSGQISNYF